MRRRVPLDEKLIALREADPHRKWHSLDDQRLCVLCDKVISGRMIELWQDERGAYHVECPTANCAATPRDWFYQASPRPFPAKLIRRRPPLFGLGSASAA